jgi:hypothetical protein
VEDTLLVPDRSTGLLRAVAGGKVYLFAFGTLPTLGTEPAIPTGTAVTGNFYDADSGGNQLNATHAWGPVTTDENGHWEAFFTTQQRLYVVYSDDNHTALIAGTSRTIEFEQFIDTQDMTAAVATGGSSTITLQDEAAVSLGAVDTIQVIGAQVDVTSSTAVWNALGQATDYVVVQETNGDWAMKRKDANDHMFADPDAIVAINAAAEELRVANLGGSIGFVGFPDCNSALRVDGDGIHLWGAGAAKQGDNPPSGLILSGVSSPYVGGLGSTPFVSFYGASCGIHNVHIDADELAKKAIWIVPQPTTHPQSDGTSGSDQNAGNHFIWENSAAFNGCEQTVHWEGADGLCRGGEMRMGVVETAYMGLPRFRWTAVTSTWAARSMSTARAWAPAAAWRSSTATRPRSTASTSRPETGTPAATTSSTRSRRSRSRAASSGTWRRAANSTGPASPMRLSLVACSCPRTWAPRTPTT